MKVHVTVYLQEALKYIQCTSAERKAPTVLVQIRVYLNASVKLPTVPWFNEFYFKKVK